MLEVARYAYTVGENIADDAAKMRHFIQGATDSGHLELLRARLDEAWLDLSHTLEAYTVEPQPGCLCGCAVKADTYEALSDGGADYVIRLHFPDDTYPHLGRSLMQCMRRYLASCVKAEWDGLTGRDASLSEMNADKALQRLRVLISSRTTVGRVKPYDY